MKHINADKLSSIFFSFFLFFFSPFFSPYVSTTIITLMQDSACTVRVWYDRLPTLHTHTLHLCLWETYKSNCSVCPSLFLSSSLIFLHTTYTCTYSSIVLILCVHYHAWHTCFQSYLKLMSGCLSLVKLRFAEIHALLNVHKQFA